jgi:hypothetical protein
MASPNKVLVLNPDGKILRRDEDALRQNGFEVISVNTPLEARFEIEMGRCGTFLTCYLTPVSIYRSLADLFKRFCPEGVVIFVAESIGGGAPSADINLTAEGDAAIVEKLRAKLLEAEPS